MLRNKIKELKAENSELQEEIDGLDETLDEKEEEVAKLEENFNSLQGMCQFQEVKLLKIKDQLRKTRINETLLRDDLEELQEKLDSQKESRKMMDKDRIQRVQTMRQTMLGGAGFGGGAVESLSLSLSLSLFAGVVWDARELSSACGVA